MPIKLSSVELNIPNIKSLIVGLSDDDRSLLFHAEVLKPIGTGDRGSTIVPVQLTATEVDILLRIAKR